MRNVPIVVVFLVLLASDIHRPMNQTEEVDDTKRLLLSSTMQQFAILPNEVLSTTSNTWTDITHKVAESENNLFPKKDKFMAIICWI